ncbi:NUDIX domain-containing protein [Enterovirga aerilata]|uniref:NUDIX domain-containing protein n=1 Tax=Enterovirga aerilata TaxID=2730920 RepID=A0A849IFC6_9HYPH|nr:NUDIX domain-containing protein [Enterovirga sp. DB1703]NNM74667.1 NUDIX domain-containing protein [Enterovirga sp. DB1703]
MVWQRIVSSSAAQRVLRRGTHAWFLLSRGMTLGVRGAVIDEAGRICLIRHTYAPGWHLPGGGIELGEDALRALARELREEAAIELTGTPVLHGVFLNAHASRRDHVLLFVVRQFERLGEKRPDLEIAECRFFAPDALPPDTTPGTCRRLLEIAEGRVPAAIW